MPALNNFSAAEKEDDQLGRTTQAEEKEEDPDHMDVMEEEEALEEEGKGLVYSCILLVDTYVRVCIMNVKVIGFFDRIQVPRREVHLLHQKSNQNPSNNNSLPFASRFSVPNIKLSLPDLTFMIVSVTVLL